MHFRSVYAWISCRIRLAVLSAQSASPQNQSRPRITRISRIVIRAPHTVCIRVIREIRGHGFGQSRPNLNRRAYRLIIALNRQPSYRFGRDTERPRVFRCSHRPAGGGGATANRGPSPSRDRRARPDAVCVGQLLRAALCRGIPSAVVADRSVGLPGATADRLCRPVASAGRRGRDVLDRSGRGWRGVVFPRHAVELLRPWHRCRVGLARWRSPSGCTASV